MKYCEQINLWLRNNGLNLVGHPEFSACAFYLFYALIHISELLLMKMFHLVKTSLNKNELRYLMRKFRFPDDKMLELEQIYHGKEKLQERVYHAMLFWKELKGPLANVEELVRIMHIVGYEKLAQNLRSMKIIAQSLKL